MVLKNSLGSEFKQLRTPPKNAGGGRYKRRLKVSVRKGGGNSPPPKNTNKNISSWKIPNQKLDKVVDMMAKVRCERVSDDFAPSRHEIALAGSRFTCWSEYSITLDHYWSPDWDNKQYGPGNNHSVSQIVNTATYKQGITVYGIKVKNTGIEYKGQKVIALKSQISAVESRLEKMKLSVWLCKVLLGTLIGILVLVEKSWGSLAMFTLEEIKKKLMSA